MNEVEFRIWALNQMRRASFCDCFNASFSMTDGGILLFSISIGNEFKVVTRGHEYTEKFAEEIEQFITQKLKENGNENI